MLVDFEKISESNYVRKSSKSNNYWFSIYYNKLNEYKERYKDNFNVIVYDGDRTDFQEFYILPYFLIKFLLAEEYFSHDIRPEKRWVGIISNHRLQIRNCPFDIDVALYYGNPHLISNEGKLQQIGEEEQNDYAIQNRIAEVQIRVKQSVFRRNVLLNFKGNCCITGIKESELIVASHIVPWSAKIESRLDPSNGLSLFITYDKLFDLGYFSFDNNLKILITNKVDSFSPELTRIIKGLDGKEALRPSSFPIKKEYLEYHRDTVFLH